MTGGRAGRGGTRSRKVEESQEAIAEPQWPQEPRLRQSGRHPRRGQKARDQGQRERQQREQELREQQAREQQAREQRAREQDQRERQQREQGRREQEAAEQSQRKQEAREQKARAQLQRKQRQRKQRQRKQRQRKPAMQRPPAMQRTPAQGQLPPAAARAPVTSVQRVRSSRPSRRVMSRRVIWVMAGVLLIAVGATAVKFMTRSAGGPAHVLVTPPGLGSYARNARLAQSMDAEALRKGIVQRSSGEARNVVDAVYEGTAGSASKAGPPIILFIGGNLAGTSPGGFMSSFTADLAGAVTIAPGSLGGAAACVPSVNGRLAECAWADGDTFGVLASPNLGEAALASELRQMRPLVERSVK